MDIKKHIVTITTDGATNMVKMGKLLPCEHLKCQAHSIHLAVIDVLYKNKDEQLLDSSFSDENDSDSGSSVEDKANDAKKDETYSPDYFMIIQKIRKISSFFRRSPVSNDRLSCYVDNKETCSLIMDVRTRWNSMVNMIQWFLKLKKPIQKALIDLNRMDLMPSIEEIKVAEELVNALEVVKCGVEALSSNKCHITMADTI